MCALLHAVHLSLALTANYNETSCCGVSGLASPAEMYYLQGQGCVSFLQLWTEALRNILLIHE